MDKKTLTIVVVVVAIVVVGGGLYYGINRWRQEQLARQILGMYGVNTNGSLANSVAQQIANQIANDQNNQNTNEEAAKTPEGIYNQASEAALIGDISPVLTGEVKPKVESVFGKAKVTTYTSGLTGTQDSFMVAFMVPRVVTAADIGKLIKGFTDSGFKLITNTANASSGGAVLEKEGAMLSLSYGESGEDQQVSVLYTPSQQ